MFIDVEYNTEDAIGIIVAEKDVVVKSISE